MTRACERVKRSPRAATAQGDGTATAQQQRLGLGQRDDLHVAGFDWGKEGLARVGSGGDLLQEEALAPKDLAGHGRQHAAAHGPFHGQALRHGHQRIGLRLHAVARGQLHAQRAAVVRGHQWSHLTALFKTAQKKGAAPDKNDKNDQKHNNLFLARSRWYM
jgi:hypothetical protein